MFTRALRQAFLLGIAVLSCIPAVLATPGPGACLALQNNLHLENTTVLNVSYIATPQTVSVAGSCGSSATVTSAPLCRVYFVINTTSTSATHAEAWLPDTWFGRFLGLGNGGTNGCIDYSGLDYGASLHFAAVGSDNGHDGSGGLPFLDHPEVINDFAWRAVHVEAVIGKQLAEAYYGSHPAKSYYLGCSTGGRQGTQAALRFPKDFDGIVAGSPATDWNNLQGWSGMLGHFVGAPSTTSPKSLSPADFTLITAAILEQCDALDGVVDGIISEPDICNFNAEGLLCTAGKTTGCLTRIQLDAVNNIYSPLLDPNGHLLYPRYSPGAEADPVHAQLLGGQFFTIDADWERYAVLNVSEHDFTNYSLADVLFMDKLDVGGIDTFSGEMEPFRARGGKLLTYHGRRDPLISSTNSKRVYELIRSTLKLPTLDDFYRLFLIPGMGHCSGGLGPTSFGQGSIGLNLVNDSAHNILLALVDWVEGGVAPATIIGTNSTGAMRTHCRYPMTSIWNGAEFVCVGA